MADVYTHTFQDAAAATGTGTVWSVSPFGTAGVFLTISATATVTFEAAGQDDTYRSVFATNAATGAMATTATATGTYVIDVRPFDKLRVRISSFGSGTVTALGLATEIGGGVALPTVMGVFGGSAFQVGAITPAADGQSGSVVTLATAGYNLLFNGATWDRERTNLEGTLLASAARTATVASADQTNHNARGVRIFINVTAVTATPSITVAVQEKDPISGNYQDILVSSAITTTGQKTTLVVYPGITAAANVKVDEPLPRTWRVNVVHGDADSITYSVGYALIL